jgi:hypothetical protein
MRALKLFLYLAGFEDTASALEHTSISVLLRDCYISVNRGAFEDLPMDEIFKLHYMLMGWFGYACQQGGPP